MRSFWVAEDKGPGQWLEIDLEKVVTVRAFQVNYHDDKADTYGRQEGLYHAYVVESSVDGRAWIVMKDKTQEKTDTPHDYAELPAPVAARFVRFRNVHAPTPHLAVSGFRIFGNGPGRRHPR